MTSDDAPMDSVYMRWYFLQHLKPSPCLGTCASVVDAHVYPPVGTSPSGTRRRSPFRATARYSTTRYLADHAIEARMSGRRRHEQRGRYGPGSIIVSTAESSQKQELARRFRQPHPLRPGRRRQDERARILAHTERTRILPPLTLLTVKLNIVTSYLCVCLLVLCEKRPARPESGDFPRLLIPGVAAAPAIFLLSASFFPPPSLFFFF
ncbi:hypothetical protein ACQKWADRAFT_169507 [Trichoderma austrokoningii]